MGTVEENNANAPMAFALTAAAGMATCLGAAIVFSRRLVKLASKRFLAGSLGLAAGVMLYVSLVEIFVKSEDSFANHGYAEADAYLYATLSLFGGIIFYKGLDYGVHLLEGNAGEHDVDIDLYDLDEVSLDGGAVGDAAPSGEVVKGESSAKAEAAPKVAPTGAGGSVLLNDARKPAAGSRNASREFPRDHDVVVELSSGSAVLPSPDLHTLHLRVAGKVQQQHKEEILSPVSPLTPENKSTSGGILSAIEEANVGGGGAGDVNGNAGTEGAAQAQVRDKKLVRMGMMTALAIGIHNFPEGLATFVATLADPAVGAALAVAIAIHNIPEGLCVAIPVYYATGNRWKAFGWAFVSGLSEPIGAGLGWLILKDVMSEMVYGILFGMVAGMMINISLQELIPTAVRYDPTDKVTTNSIIVGMAIMAASLALFMY